MDLRKAFDKMVLKSVLNDLWKANIRGKIWRNIYQINKTARIKIKTDHGLTDEVQIGEILKQGSVLASTIAALHTDNVNGFFQHSGLGVKYGNTVIQNLLFQDDIARIETNSENLNKANIIHEVYQNVNRMDFHGGKTIYITNDKEDKVVVLNGKKLNREEHSKYLGDILSQNNSYDAMLEDRKNSVNGITAELRAIIGDADSHMEIKAAIQYTNGIIVPKLLNNAETWNNLTKQKS